MNVCLKVTMDDFVYVFDARRKWSCGVVCVWSRTNSDTIVSMFIWFFYLKWMIFGGKLISTSVENFSSWRNSFGPGPHFCQQNKHIPLEKMITWTTCKAVNCFSTVVCVKYSIVTSHFNTSTSAFITLVNSAQTSQEPTRAQSKKTMWRLKITFRSIFVKKWARNIPQKCK